MSATARRRTRAIPREAWITDPFSLLAALASAEQAELARRPARSPILVTETPREPPPAPRDAHPQPERIPFVLREDEQMSRAMGQDPVIVILRRRRAA